MNSGLFVDRNGFSFSPFERALRLALVPLVRSVESCPSLVRLITRNLISPKQKIINQSINQSIGFVEILLFYLSFPLVNFFF